MVSTLREHQLVGGRVEVLELNGEEVASWRLNLFDHELPTVGGRPWVAGSNFGCTVAAYDAIGGFDESVSIGEDLDLSLRMHAVGITAVFAAGAIVHYRYRNEPRQAVRQMWKYGTCREPLYARYGLEPPTFVDTLVRGYRDSKAAVREGLRGRRPVGPALDFAFVLGEASVVWRYPGFWHPGTRIVSVGNPLSAQRDRLGRLGRLIAGGVRGGRG
jgi:hypothetical protein